MTKNKIKSSFSVVIPTYTGEEHIKNCLESIMLSANNTDTKYEVVVVIDGPNVNLRKIVNNVGLSFKKRGVVFRIHQFKVNKGRFDARLKGARLAEYEQLLFVDDRVTLDGRYFTVLNNIEDSIAIPSVIEKQDILSPISFTLRTLRKKIYGKKWGNSFEDYYINEENFDRSPKGTTSLWVDKSSFLKACAKVGQNKSNKYTNEDTKILRELLNEVEGILRTDSLRIYYSPRLNFNREARHIYERAPRFVDYYFSPNKRYFWIMLVFYITLILIPILSILYFPLFPLLIISSYILSIFLGSAFLAGRKVGSFYLLLTGLTSISVLFSLGLVKGIFVKLKS